MYEYAAGDLRGNTTEMVRAKSPEHARKSCVALGVPEEHVQTWAARSEADEHRAELRALRDQADDARQSARDANAEQREAERDRQLVADELRVLKRHTDEIRRAVDDAHTELSLIAIEGLPPAVVERIENALRILGAA